jgi:hypothetical protein
MSEIKRGQLKLFAVTRVFEASCGRCQFDLTLSTTRSKQHIERELRKRGWQLTGRYGWICTTCASKRRKRKDGTVEERD